jgi:hypothetical protein
MRGRRVGLLYVLFFVFWMVWWPLYANLSGAGVRTYSGAVSFVGSLEPGGILWFRVKPDISSVLGTYHATVRIEPALSGTASVSWSSVTIERGTSWESTITVPSPYPGDTQVPSFEVELRIPDDPELSGETATITVRVRIDYPRYAGGTSYTTERKDITETFRITIGEKTAESSLQNILTLIWLAGLPFLLVSGVVLARRYKTPVRKDRRL